jgi:hypothetical protein
MHTVPGTRHMHTRTYTHSIHYTHNTHTHTHTHTYPHVVLLVERHGRATRTEHRIAFSIVDGEEGWAHHDVFRKIRTSLCFLGLMKDAQHTLVETDLLCSHFLVNRVLRSQSGWRGVRQQRSIGAKLV